MTTLSYSFYTKDLNNSKYQLLKEKALILRDFRNEISKYIFENKLDKNNFLSSKLSRVKLNKELKSIKPKDISEKMYEGAILEVLTMYNNRRQEVRKPFRRPINFTKLTFSNTNVLGRKQHESIIGINKNDKSSIKHFLKLSAITGKRGELLNIPIKINKKYHGKDIKEFNNSTVKGTQFNVSYTVQFIGKNKLRFILTKPGTVSEEFQPEIEKPIGVDVNIKHNLFVGYDGTSKEYYEVNHNKKFLREYISFLKYLDRKKMNKAKYKNKEKGLSKRDQSKYETYLRRLKGIYDETISSFIYHLKNDNYNTVVLEDLGKLPKSFSRMEEFKGFKVSRLSRLLRLAEIKNIFKRLGNKYEVKVLTVNPAYTSQQCPSCNHISKSNRKTQEMFSCVECGYENNADVNASINILHRYTKYNEVNDFKNHKQIKTFFEDLSLNVAR